MQVQRPLRDVADPVFAEQVCVADAQRAHGRPDVAGSKEAEAATLDRGVITSSTVPRWTFGPRVTPAAAASASAVVSRNDDRRVPVAGAGERGS